MRRRALRRRYGRGHAGQSIFSNRSTHELRAELRRAKEGARKYGEGPSLTALIRQMENTLAARTEQA